MERIINKSVVQRNRAELENCIVFRESENNGGFTVHDE